MDFIREQLSSEMVSSDVEIPVFSVEARLAMANAIAVLQQHRAQFPNAQDELDEFIYHPEIIAMTH